MLSCQRDKFSLPADVHYLNCAYMSPLPKCVEEAGISALAQKRDPSRIVPDDFFRASDAVRDVFAEIVGAESGLRISLAPSASYGVASVARNLNVSAGGEIVLLFEQFPSHVYTWHRLASERGLAVRTITPPVDGLDRGKRWNERVLDAISPRTAAVCLPTVHWTDGTRFDLAAISRRARDAGAAFVLDGTQSVGASPIDVNEIQPDALICAGYKWLMGPYSTGMVYWSERYDHGVPIEENWISRLDSEDFAGLVDYQEAYKPGAVRYDVGERSNFILMPMMLEALRLVRALGPKRIREYCAGLTSGFFNAARELGYRIEDDAFRSAHLFGIRVPDTITLERLKEAVAARGVSVSIRGSAVRVSPNVYNDANDIDRLLDALAACANEPVR